MLWQSAAVSVNQADLHVSQTGDGNNAVTFLILWIFDD